MQKIQKVFHIFSFERKRKSPQSKPGNLPLYGSLSYPAQVDYVTDTGAGWLMVSMMDLSAIVTPQTGWSSSPTENSSGGIDRMRL